ncbi:MAG: hypothetical protein ACREP9_20815, partial [Candidatus Dormibacteraceae bacterium]
MFLTNDFQHFIDATPPAVLTETAFGYPFFEQAFFLNPYDGWVSTFSSAAAEVDIYRTTDGGSHWTAVSGTGHTASAGGVTYFQFLSPTSGYLDTLQPTGPVASLSASSDGGASWKPVSSSNALQTSSLPLGRATFLDSNQAIVVRDGLACTVGTPGSGVWTSSDRGVSWIPVSLPAPFTPKNDSVACPAIPVVSPNGIIMPTAFVTSDSTAQIGFLVSTSGGDHWTILADSAVTLEASPVPQGAVAPDGSLWVMGELNSGPYSVAISNDAGKHWSDLQPQGLPSGGAVHAVLPFNSQRAWVVADQGPNVLLYTTSDGGKTFSQ